MQSSDHPKNQFKSNYIDPDEALIAYNEKQMSILTRSEALLEHAKTDKELLDIMEQLQKEQEEVEPPVHPEFGRLVWSSFFCRAGSFWNVQINSEIQ